MAKYLVVGGWVRSKNDGDWYWVSPVHLVRLYRVPRSECILVDKEGGLFIPNLEILTPRHDGDYPALQENS